MSYECVLKCGKSCTPSDTISKTKWNSLREKTQNWSGLDKYGDVYHTTSWDQGPDNFYMHESCYIYVSSSRKLEQAKKHKTRDESTSSTMEEKKQ